MQQQIITRTQVAINKSVALSHPTKLGRQGRNAGGGYFVPLVPVHRVVCGAHTAAGLTSICRSAREVRRKLTGGNAGCAFLSKTGVDTDTYGRDRHG